MSNLGGKPLTPTSRANPWGPPTPTPSLKRTPTNGNGATNTTGGNPWSSTPRPRTVTREMERRPSSDDKGYKGFCKKNTFGIVALIILIILIIIGLILTQTMAIADLKISMAVLVGVVNVLTFTIYFLNHKDFLRPVPIHNEVFDRVTEIILHICTGFVASILWIGIFDRKRQGFWTGVSLGIFTPLNIFTLLIVYVFLK